MLFTGYYEPKLTCRQARDEVHRYPLYKRPDDIIEVDLSQFGNGLPKNKLLGRLEGKRVIPYFSREEIDQKKALANRKLEMLWCSDLVDIFFLQVQGSGKVDLGDGNLLSVLYDGQNGRSYRSIGKYLIDAGIIPKEEMTMQITRQYLRDNPEKTADDPEPEPELCFLPAGQRPFSRKHRRTAYTRTFNCNGQQAFPEGRACVHFHDKAEDRERSHNRMGPVNQVCHEPGHRRRHQGAGQGRSVLGPGAGSRNRRRPYAAGRGAVFPVKEEAAIE